MHHRLLNRQLRRLDLGSGMPPDGESWTQFLKQIDRSYEAIDRERYLVEHSVQLASREMQELNAKLSQEQDTLVSVFRATPVGLTITDPEGRILQLNRALEEVIGFSCKETVGKLFWEMMTAEDAAAAQRSFEDLVANRVSTMREQHRLIARDGHPVLAEIVLSKVAVDEDKARFVIASVQDITGRIELEMELRHAQKLESVGRLAAGIAHEINTPIQFVGDNVNFMSDSIEQLLGLCDSYRKACAKARDAPLSAEDLEELKKEEELADFEYIRGNVASSIASTIDGVGRVARIVQSMKAFAHPDQGELATADLNAALRDTLTVATNELKYVATVETDFGEVPAIPCFIGDLNQVFLNLLVNAAHAIGDVVDKTGQRGVIRVRTYLEGSIVVVAISDTGTGIPEAVRGRIFDPFFTTKEVGKGTGQGLALARAVVVEKHNGALTFETEMGKGTTFFVRIPFDFF
jgi:PAS domain S-box-containing protein